MKYIHENPECQQKLKKNIKHIVKDVLGMTEGKFAEKIGWTPQQMRTKLSVKGRFSLSEALFIANQLGEYVEDLCEGEI